MSTAIIGDVDAHSLPNLPYFKDVGVLGFVPQRWATPWQPRHQVLSRLAKYFHVVWINPASGWRELWGGEQRDSQHSACAKSPPGLTVYEPGKLLPLLYRPQLVSQAMERFRLRQAHRILVAKGSRKVVAYLWRPHFAAALDLIPHDVSCYHIDDEYTFSPVEQPLGKEEAALIARVDQVFIHSPALMEKKGNINPHTLSVPNGVDYRAFSTPMDEPDDMKHIPHPRIGYVGQIKVQLDFPTLLTLARRHREWSFVFVGPVKPLGEWTELMSILSRLPNVYFLGGKPVDALPGYVQHLDVCTMCYVLNDYTKFIYPLKLHEYLAAGLAVVSSPIHSLLEFGDVVKLARTPEEWSHAMTEALAPCAKTQDQRERRRAIARQYDWELLVRRLTRALCERLGPSYLARFEEMPQ